MITQTHFPVHDKTLLNEPMIPANMRNLKFKKKNATEYMKELMAFQVENKIKISEIRL